MLDRAPARANVTNRPVRHVSRVLLSTVLAAAGLATDRALAVDKDWISPSGGLFNQTNNWDPVGIPGAADRAIFDLDASYTVSFLDNRTNSRVSVADDSVVFNLNGTTYTLTNAASTSLIVGGAFRTFAGAGQLTVSDGTLSAVSGELGRAGIFGTGGQGTLTITSDGAVRFTQILAVGSSRRGTLIVDGGQLFGSINTIGLEDVGVATISGANAAWTNTNWIDVGGGAAGSLSILAGAEVFDDFAAVGVGSGISGNVTVDGPDSRWTHDTELRIGQLGHGVLNVTGGGMVRQPQLGAIGIIADEATSTGVVNISGASSRWQSTFGDLTIGRLGDATVTLSDGAGLSNPNGDAFLALSGLSTSAITIGGGNATWNAERIFIGGGTSTQGGSGIVNVNPGGALNAANLGRIRVWGTGTINLSGGRIQTGSLQLSGGAFNWTSGELQITNEPVFVDAGGMLGNDVAIGAGKVLLVPELRVGSTGAGTLAAAGGGSISATDLFVGHGSFAAGTVAVSGAGTRLDAGSLAVGLAGTGNVLVSSGATLSTSGFGALGANIGSFAGSNGLLSVDGAGTVFEYLNDQGNPSTLVVGALGDGTLRVSNGGLVNLIFGYADLGAGSNSTGTALVSGGGRWHIEYDLRVGFAGNGHIGITGGSTLNNQHASLAGTPGTQATAIVNGNGSAWQSAGELVIGDFGTAVATFSGGAHVAAANTSLALGMGSSGQVTLSDPGTTLISNGSMALLIVGGGGTGQLRILNGAVAQAEQSIIGDGTDSSGTILISGSGSLLHSPEILVGFSGDGTLTILAGAAVNSNETFMADSAGSSGRLHVEGGTFTAASLLAVSTGARVQYNAGTLSVGTLAVSGTGLVTLSTGSDKVVEAERLSMSPMAGGTIDLADNFMIVDYSGATELGVVAGAVRGAYSNGSWNGNGITSFLADDTVSSVAYAEASDVFTSFPASFGGRMVDDTSILVRLTRYGDANLDGQVNLLDFNRLAGNFGTAGGAVWSMGDFSHDGVVNLADFNKLAANFGMTVAGSAVMPRDWANLAALVPEPAGVVALAGALSSAVVARGRRRRGR